MRMVCFKKLFGPKQHGWKKSKILHRYPQVFPRLAIGANQMQAYKIGGSS